MVAGIAQCFWGLAGVPRALVHRLEQTFQTLGKNLVTFRAAEPSGFFEIRLRKTATRAFQFHATGRLRHFLSRAETEHDVSIRHQESRRIIVETLGFGAGIAKIQILLFVIGRNLRKKKASRVFLCKLNTFSSRP